MTKEEEQADLFDARLRDFEDVARHRKEMERLAARHIEMQEKLNEEYREHVARIERAHEDIIALLTSIANK